jgi:hypothetical protein
MGAAIGVGPPSLWSHGALIVRRATRPSWGILIRMAQPCQAIYLVFCRGGVKPAILGAGRAMQDNESVIDLID